MYSSIMRTSLALLATAAVAPAIADAELQGPFLIGVEASGANVVPGPGDSDAVAQIGLEPYPSERKVCYQLDSTGLGLATGAYIRKGGPGEQGPLRLTLFEDTAGVSVDTYTSDCVTGLKKRLVKRLARRSSLAGQISFDWSWYAEIRTVEFPAGALRGQLGAGMPCPTCVIPSASLGADARRTLPRESSTEGFLLLASVAHLEFGREPGG
jgi:hypothetical protein